MSFEDPSRKETTGFRLHSPGLAFCLLNSSLGAEPFMELYGICFFERFKSWWTIHGKQGCSFFQLETRHFSLVDHYPWFPSISLTICFHHTFQNKTRSPCCGFLQVPGFFWLHFLLIFSLASWLLHKFVNHLWSLDLCLHCCWWLHIHHQVSPCLISNEVGSLI